MRAAPALLLGAVSAVVAGIAWRVLVPSADFENRVLPCVAAQGSRAGILAALKEPSAEQAKRVLTWNRAMLDTRAHAGKAVRLADLVDRLISTWDDKTAREAVIEQINRVIVEMCDDVQPIIIG